MSDPAIPSAATTSAATTSATDTSATEFTAVVGVDGSANSLSALQWAHDHVGAHGGGTVRAVMCWGYTTLGAIGLNLGGSLPPADAMQEATEAALADVLSGVVTPDGVTLTSTVAEGTASTVILENSEGADLIVLGKRGHGGFRGLLLGSVANQVANHAESPVVIVPA